MSELSIIDYNEDYVASFADLNKAWLKKYFVVEPIDEAIFANPQQYIIAKGGQIFFALMNEKVVGTFALIKVEEGMYELSKMAVSEEYRGRNIGNKMLQFCIEKAGTLNAKKVILYSNTLLAPAIHLYKKFGFKEVPLGQVDYKRANIKMEIEIN